MAYFVRRGPHFACNIHPSHRGRSSFLLPPGFNDAGLIESAHVEARAATVGKTIVMMPWEARVSNYQERSGMRVPLTGEASWLPPQGRRPYWRGIIASLAYEFPSRGWQGGLRMRLVAGPTSVTDPAPGSDGTDPRC
jgi:hypothetical protein